MTNKSANDERVFTVAAADTGQRLDRFLAEHCPDLSRNQIQNVLAADLVLVDGRSRPKSYRLNAGNRIIMRPLPVREPHATPQDIPLDLVYADEDLLIVNKPAGLVVHPAPGHPEGTLVNALLYHCQQLSDGGDPLRPGIVHRLDRDTTGLLAVALTDAAHRSLEAQLRSREMKRIYLALSWGRWPEQKGVIEAPIGRHPRERQKMAVVTRGGRPAKTHYIVEEDFEFVQLCRVSLSSGRTHQIRVHFAHLSHPLVGDPVYGDDRRARNVRPVERSLAARLVKHAPRQMLHAAELTLRHPKREETMQFQAPLPADFASNLDLLRLSAT